MRWGENVTLEFVKIYLKRECLWNPEHSGYKVKKERDKAYKQIQAEFRESSSKELSIHEIKVKIKNLRTTYLQQVNKILQKSSPDCIFEPSLIWFNEMDRYLKHISVNRHSSSQNFQVQQAPEVDSSSQIWVDDEIQAIDQEVTTSDPLTPQNNYSNESSPEDSNMKKPYTSTPHRKVKKKKYKHRAQVYSVPDANSETSVRDDEFDIYGKYIASQLRLMNLNKALRLQLQIQSLVSKARTSDT